MNAYEIQVHAVIIAYMQIGNMKYISLMFSSFCLWVLFLSLI